MTLLIFDCDGVLVDSELLAHEALAELMTALGRPMTTQQALQIFSGLRLGDVLESAEALLSFPMPGDLGAAAGQRLFERFRRELQPVKGVREALDMLPYPRCVASSSTRERVDLSIEITGLTGLFGDNIFSAGQVEHASLRQIFTCSPLAHSEHYLPIASSSRTQRWAFRPLFRQG
jgi:beta-phosphoglucomutase-like phosphatase (HAD superfamily)